MNKLSIQISQQGIYPWLSSLWHIQTIVISLKQNETFRYTTSMIVTQRHVIISSYSSNNISGCMYTVYFDPRAALKSPIDAYQLSQYSLICRKIPAILTIGKNNKILATQERTEGQCTLNNLTAYFIITGPFYTSWQEAAEICSTIGAHLPTIISDDESILLEKLMLGSVFNQSRKSEY